jgi:hypothetical protein
MEVTCFKGTRVGPSSTPELSAEKLPSGSLPVGRANHQSAKNASWKTRMLPTKKVRACMSMVPLRIRRRSASVTEWEGSAVVPSIKPIAGGSTIRCANFVFQSSFANFERL